jgi:soluble lytic murein transglycosylase-like protein
MLKTMRKTIPKNPFADNQFLNNEAGQEIYTEMFDMELSRKVAAGGEGSMAQILFDSMEPLVEAAFADPAAGVPVEIKSLLGEKKVPLSLSRESLDIVDRRHSIRAVNASDVSIRGGRRTTPDDKISARFGREIRAAARRYKVDPVLIHSVIRAESNGNPKAVSRAGAKGLMQLMDSTARSYDAKDVFDPAQNINAGTKYLKHLMDRFGEEKLALAAYNAGPSNVVRHGGVPPFPETQAYVEKVMDSVSRARDELRATNAKATSHSSR